MNVQDKFYKYFWIIGCPRSGTTFLTNLIGEQTKYCFNEPWALYPLSKHKYWNLPKDGDVTFKYCANCFFYEEINQIYLNSIWIYIERDPKHVLYSMVFGKEDSKPARSFPEISKEKNIYLKIQKAFEMQKIFRNQCNKINPNIRIQYENINYELIEDSLKIKLNRNKFVNRNYKFDKSKMKLLMKFI